MVKGNSLCAKAVGNPRNLQRSVGTLRLGRELYMEPFEQVSAIVRKYLWSNVGNMTVPGTPRFDAEVGVWHVPVLCDTDRGNLPIGEIQLDEALNFVQLPSKAELEEAALCRLRTTAVLVYADPEQLREKGFVPVTN